jgi:hypothetical protein
VSEPKPRTSAWFRSNECVDLEQQIITRIREATGTSSGTLRVSV